eukprot:gene11319-biopygen22878
MVRGRIGGAPTPHMYRKTRGASPPGVWGGAAYRGRLRARATGNGPALQGWRVRRLQAYWCAPQFLGPLRARSTVYGPALLVSGPYCWGPNPRHMRGGVGAVYGPALQDSGARAVGYGPALQ